MFDNRSLAPLLVDRSSSKREIEGYSGEIEDTHISILQKIMMIAFMIKTQARNNAQNQTYCQGKKFMYSTVGCDRVELNHNER